MNDVASTIISSRGQVVIPKEMRDSLNLHAGTKMLIIKGRDSLILKTMERPSEDEVRAMLKRIHTDAKKAGLRKKDLEDAIREARGKK